MFDQLLKLLNTASTAEPDKALQAIRLASQLLQDSGYSWEDVIADPEYVPPAEPIKELPRMEPAARSQEITMMFEAVYSKLWTLNTQKQKFIRSIADQYQRTNVLTTKQFKGLQRFYYHMR